MGPIPISPDALAYAKKLSDLKAKRAALVKSDEDNQRIFMEQSPDANVRALSNPNLSSNERASLPAPNYFAPLSVSESQRAQARIAQSKQYQSDLAAIDAELAAAENGTAPAQAPATGIGSVAIDPSTNKPVEKPAAAPVTRPAVSTTQPKKKPIPQKTRYVKGQTEPAADKRQQPVATTPQKPKQPAVGKGNVPTKRSVPTPVTKKPVAQPTKKQQVMPEPTQLDKVIIKPRPKKTVRHTTVYEFKGVPKDKPMNFKFNNDGGVSAFGKSYDKSGREIIKKPAIKPRVVVNSKARFAVTLENAKKRDEEYRKSRPMLTRRLWQ
jgi:hypothetical protein